MQKNLICGMLVLVAMSSATPAATTTHSYIIRMFMGDAIPYRSRPVDEGGSGSSSSGGSSSGGVVNNAPLFDTIPPSVVYPGATYTYEIAASDADVGDILSIAAILLPDWLTLTDNGNGTAVMSGSTSEIGAYAVSLRVSDGHGGSTTQDFTVRVDTSPVFDTVPPAIVPPESLYTYNISASSPREGDTLAITAPSLPEWLTFVDNGDGTATLSGTAPASGTFDVSLVVADGRGNANTQDFTISIDNAPVFDTAPWTMIDPGVTYTYEIATSDPDAGDTLDITAAILPDWLAFTDNGDGTATLSGSTLAVGSYDVVLNVSDGRGGEAMQSFAILVNSAPVFTSSPPTSAVAGGAFSYAITANDADAGDRLAIAATTLPDWLTLADNGDGTATLSGTVPASGTFNVSLKVTDSRGDEATQDFTISLNSAPAFTSTPVTLVTVGSAYAYSVAAEDPDTADVLTISVVSKPSWMTFSDGGNGTASLSGIPLSLGTANVSLKVSDGHGGEALQDFSVRANAVPVFTSTAVTSMTELGDYSYSVTADDADVDDMLALTAPIKPDWLILADNGNRTGLLFGSVPSYGSQNVAPAFTTTPGSAVTTRTEGQQTQYDLSVADTNKVDTVLVTTVTKPSWLTLVWNGNQLRTAKLYGVAPLLTPFARETNATPTFSTTPGSSITATTEGTALNYAITVADTNKVDAVLVTTVTKPSWLTLTWNGNQLRTANLVGTAPLLSSTDPQVNVPPTFSTTPGSSITSTTEGTAINYSITVADANTVDAILPTAPTLPSWLALSWNGNQLRTAKLYGVAPLMTALSPPANFAPTFTSSPVTTATQGATYTYNISFSDSNKVDTVKLTAPTLPAWLALTDNGNQQRTGKITGTAPSASGTHNVTLRVTDASGESVDQTFTITIP